MKQENEDSKLKSRCMSSVDLVEVADIAARIDTAHSFLKGNRLRFFHYPAFEILKSFFSHICKMEYRFRKAGIRDLPGIWDILQGAIRRRKEDGSRQWQDGYPNPDVIRQDIERGAGYVLTGTDSTGADATGVDEPDTKALLGYCAVLVNDEPAYANIEGKWLTNGDFVVIHRVAVAEPYLGKGLAQHILGAVETLAREKQIHSIKADTNFDNIAMLKTFEKLGYVYCGEVYFRGSARRAYEKVLSKAG